MRAKHSNKAIASAMETVAQRLSGAAGAKSRPVLYLPGNAGRVEALEQWIFDHPARLHGVDVFQMLALGPEEGWERAVLGGVGIVTPFIGPGVRQLVNAGLARNIRCNLSQVPKLFEGRWRPTVAIAHTSPPDAQGRVTLGLNAGIDIAPLRQAAFRVALVNAQMPRWAIGVHEDPASGQQVDCGCAMNLDEFDLVVEFDAPLIEHPMEPASARRGAETRAIAREIVELLQRDARSGDPRHLPHTLQLGIGKLPNAVARELVQRGLSIRAMWSEMFSDGVLELYRAGGIRATGGATLRDHIVVGFVLGSHELYRTMHENPAFAVLPQEIVNDPALIKHNPCMTSINTALAVSLAGEVAAATIQKHYYSDVGGQFDFALGASWAPGGRAIIGLPSVVHLGDGTLQSKIVASHGEGAHHTIGADLPVVVVTEQGVADLRGLTDLGRVEAMLRITHPRWRALLAKEARALPSMQGADAIEPDLIRLQDGRTALIRPAGKGDIPGIGDYIRHMSQDDRFTRYMGTVSLTALTSVDRLARLYDETLDYRQHAAFVVELEHEIIGVAHAYRIGSSSTYEISFSRRSDLRGQGIGRHLMHMLIDWGQRVGAEQLYATTYRNKNPRMRALFDRYGFAVKADPDDHEVVIYTARIEDLRQVRLEALGPTRPAAEPPRSAPAPMQPAARARVVAVT